LQKKTNRDFSLFLRDWYRRGFKLLWGEEPDLLFNSLNDRRLWFLRHPCENTSYYDYKTTDFYLAVTESDSSYEGFMCDIALNNQIERHKFCNMNQNSIIDLTKIYNKNEVALYYRKWDPDFAYQDEYKLNPGELSQLILSVGYLYVSEEI